MGVKFILSQGSDQGRIQPVSLGGTISVIFGNQVYKIFATVREMKYTSQNCCHKTIDDEMTLYRECCFPNYTKLWWTRWLS